MGGRVDRDVVANAAMLAMHLIENLMEDDGDDNDWEKISVNVDEFCTMGDPSFRWHFRLTKPVFEILLQEIGNHLLATNRLMRERRPLAHILLMTLWIMCTPDCFRGVALRFGVHKSELHNHYVYTIEALREMGETYIAWPDQHERNRIKRDCGQISNFGGIIGIMDGSHIPIKAPAEEKAAYRNYHHDYSIKVQAVVDNELLVRDVYIGEAGSLHDARVFRRSPLCRNILERLDMFGPGEHIIADSAYMLLDKVLTPFTNNGHLTAQQRNYNKCLSKVRVRVQHTFGRVYMLWKRLFYLPSTRIEYAVDHIAASFVLHNFNLIHGGRVHGMEEEDMNCGNLEGEDEEEVDDPVVEQGVEDIIPDPYVVQGDLAHELELAHIRGEQKRWDICNRLPML